METATLTDRYVAAAVRGVPENQRDDLAAELRGSIGDQVEARVDAGELPDAAERAVLTDLGDPDKLAAAYADRPSWLIGPRYFFEWWRLTKLLLWIVPACAVFGVTLGMTIAGEGFGAIMGAIWPVLIGVVVHICFWTTLVFAILERNTGTSLLERSPLTKDGPWAPWSVDQLPEPKTRGAGFGDLIGSLVFLAIAAGAILWDHLVGFVPVARGDAPVSFLDEALWPWWITGLFALMAVEAGLAIWVHAQGRWTYAAAGVNLALDLLIAVPALILLAQGRLIAPGFFPAVLPADSAQTVAGVVAAVTGSGIVAIAAWDAIDAYLKARRAR